MEREPAVCRRSVLGENSSRVNKMQGSSGSDGGLGQRTNVLNMAQPKLLSLIFCIFNFFDYTKILFYLLLLWCFICNN